MIRRIFSRLVLIMYVVTLILGTGYVAIQQTIRMSADDPQIQRTQDIARSMSADDLYIPRSDQTRVEIDQSLAPFEIVFDDQGMIMSSTGYLNGRTPVPPIGVFDRARAQGEYRLTWEPVAGIRIATVITHVQGTNSGFVLSGRSLSESDDRISHIGMIFVMGWCFILLGTLVLLFLITPRVVPQTFIQSRVTPETDRS